jgi:hypothetical protein
MRSQTDDAVKGTLTGECNRAEPYNGRWLLKPILLKAEGNTLIEEAGWQASQPGELLSGPLPTLQNRAREIIETALAECRKVAGPKGAAAKLGIPRSTLTRESSS